MRAGKTIKGLTIALIIIQAIVITIFAVIISEESVEPELVIFLYCIVGSIYVCIFGMIFMGFGSLISIQEEKLEIARRNND